MVLFLPLSATLY